MQVLTVTAEQLRFPCVNKLILLRRHRYYLHDGHQEEGFLHLVCSRTDVSDHQILQFCRGHWIIESSVHYCRDVLFAEDRSSIRHRTTARVCATLHTLAIYCLGQNCRSRRDTRPRRQKKIGRHPGIAVRMVTQAA